MEVKPLELEYLPTMALRSMTGQPVSLN